MNVNWKENRLQWRDPDFGRFPLALDAPPDAGTFSQILHLVGEKARDANRVEVPFEFIAPPDGCLLDLRQPKRRGRAAGPGRGHQAAVTSRWARGHRSTC